MFSHRLLLLLLFTLLALTSTLCLAAPPQPWYEKYHQRRVTVPQSYYEGLSLRRQTPLRLNAVRDVVCIDPNVRFLLFDEYAASLAICGGIAGGATTTRCGGDLSETAGRSGRAAFGLRALARGAAINVSKDAWAACVSAARETCPQGSFSGVCVGAATVGDVEFRLESV